MNEASILLVDDEQAILQLLETVLRKEGFQSIDKVTSAEAALAACEQKRYDLIVRKDGWWFLSDSDDARSIDR